MVVSCEPRFFQSLCLVIREHSQRNAGFHIEAADHANHVEHAVELDPLGLAAKRN